ncbi:SAV_6107 family HEPN domain-containing protein [Nocardioides sp. CPCC 205120]|uniref:SAV_6107 family HEPN domain-containing protein n=1 Tax=Nocardioides sp. CPCC 205120 TaxID=3406462 RepID=UPI003B50CD45
MATSEHGRPEAPRPATREAVLLPPAAHTYLSRSATSLREAITETDPASRYALAHVAALRAAAAVIAARSQPGPQRRKERNAWVLLVKAAPDLADWATFFSAGAATYAAAQAGSRRAVSVEQADELVQEADRFLAVVEQALGLLPHAWTDGEGRTVVA